MAETAEKVKTLRGQGAVIEQTTPEIPAKVRAPGEQEYVVHIHQGLPAIRGRAVRAVLRTGKKIKLYPSGIVTGSGVNVCWLTLEEAKELEGTSGITYCQPRVQGTNPPAPPPPPRPKPTVQRDASGQMVEVERDEPDND